MNTQIEVWHEYQFMVKLRWLSTSLKKLYTGVSAHVQWCTSLTIALMLP